jgi:hypothetical protein
MNDAGVRRVALGLMLFIGGLGLLVYARDALTSDGFGGNARQNGFRATF